MRLRIAARAAPRLHGCWGKRVPTKLIVNPKSGTDSAPDHLVMVNRRLRERFGPVDIVITTGEDDARREGRRAVEESCDRIFIAGGDGTLNEVVNGVAAAPRGLERVTFGVIPMGTGNDFATALGIPEALDDALDVLLDDRVLAVDVGRLNDQYFVNVSAGGFIAEVSDAVNPQMKTVAGKLAYLLGGVQVLLDSEPLHVRLRYPEPATASGERLPVDAMLSAFAVCNSRLVGGGRLIAPEAVVDDGRLDACLIHVMPMMEFIGLLRRVSNGEHLEDERVTYFQTPAIDLTFDRVAKVNIDGQVLETDRCAYRILPRAARFLAGRQDVGMIGRDM